MKKRIKDICSFVSRGASPTYVDNGSCKVMNQATFSKGFIDESNLRYSTKDSIKAKIRKGDLLMASTGGGILGKVCYFDKEDDNFYADSHVTIMRDSKGHNLMKFLYYAFSIKYDEINATLVKGSTNQTELQRNYLLSYEIDMPSLENQKRIVSFLDSKLSKIEKTVSLLSQKRDAYLRLKKSIIDKAVTRGLDENVKLKDSGVEWMGEIPENWFVYRLKDISQLTPRYTKNVVEQDVSFVPMEGLRNGSITSQTIAFNEAYKKYTYFSEGDILVAKVTPCFENGNIAIAKDLLNKVGFGSSEIFVLRTNKKVLNTFLFFVIQSSKFKNMACSTMCGVGGLKRISPLFMRISEISLPPIDEQLKIVSYLETILLKIDSTVTNLETQIEKYNQLRKSLIDEVITGKRKV